MAEERITRKDLWQSMGNITPADWCNAGRRLGLSVSTSYGKGSHAVIRNPQYPDPSDMRGHITTVQHGLHKDMSHKIFKQLLNFGIAEDDIWKALKML